MPQYSALQIEIQLSLLPSAKLSQIYPLPAYPQKPIVTIYLVFQDIGFLIRRKDLEIIRGRELGVDVALVPPVQNFLDFEPDIIQVKPFGVFIGFVTRMGFDSYQKQIFFVFHDNDITHY
jgi:hypothetical protein